MTAGDGSDLVAMVVEALVQSASHTVGAAGAALGGEAVARVRESLRQWPQWAHALGRVEAYPGDQQAQWDLALAVGQLLAGDPGLAANLRARLSVAMTAPPPMAGAPVPTAAPVAPTAWQGGDVADWPGYGPATVQGTSSRRSRAWAVTGGVVVLAVIGTLTGLGFYLDSGPDGPKPLATLDQVKSVLPDLHAVPDGWTQEAAPSATPMGECSGDGIPPEEAALCPKAVGRGNSAFHADNGKTQVTFQILAGPSTAWADKMYDFANAGPSALPDKVPMDAPKAGQRSAISMDRACLAVLVESGSDVLRISYCPENPDAPNVEVVNRITRMFAARSQQAQDGKTPDAAA